MGKFFFLIEKLLSYRADVYIDSHDVPLLYDVFEDHCKTIKLIGNLVTEYENNISIIMKELVQRAEKEGIKTDKMWHQDMEFYINAFITGIRNQN